MNPDLLATMRDSFQAGAFPVYLAGAVGCGKSFTAALVYARWTGSVSMFRYCDLISDAITAEKYGEIIRTNDDGQAIEMTRGQWWRWLENVGLLIIDEIGTGMSHEWRKEMLWNVLEIRKGRPLLMTGNILLNAIGEQFDARIQSRLIEGTIIEVAGPDRRREGVQHRMHRVQV